MILTNGYSGIGKIIRSVEAHTIIIIFGCWETFEINLRLPAFLVLRQSNNSFLQQNITCSMITMSSSSVEKLSLNNHFYLSFQAGLCASGGSIFGKLSSVQFQFSLSENVVSY